ncbi:MAG: ATP-binding protein [Acidobacteriota bacterium]
MVRVDSLLSDVREFLAAEARSLGAHLRVLPGLPEAELRCDPAQLRQVLINLVLNAVQAVRELPGSRRVVELSADRRPEAIALVVRDRGDGIPEEEIDRVRRAFYTSRRGGTGLGLAIAERFAEAHGGTIELDNMEPYGFEARVVLPIEPEAVKING